jgi:hypothetical protein
VGAARERAQRGRELVLAGAYLVTPGGASGGSAVLVYSDRPGVPGYTVEDGRCTCPDATVGQAARLGIACKHAVCARWVLAERRATVFPRRAAPPLTTKRLPPRDGDAWLDAQDAARSRAARRLEEIATEMGR